MGLVLSQDHTLHRTKVNEKWVKEVSGIWQGPWDANLFGIFFPPLDSISPLCWFQGELPCWEWPLEGDAKHVGCGAKLGQKRAGLWKVHTWVVAMLIITVLIPITSDVGSAISLGQASNPHLSNWRKRTSPPCCGVVPWDETGPLIHCCCCCCLVAQSCLTLCDPMDCSPPGSSVHGIF